MCGFKKDRFGLLKFAGNQQFVLVGQHLVGHNNRHLCALKGNIREYVEQRERELCLDGCELDVQEEIIVVERMYEGVKREIESTKSGGENRTGTADYTRRSFLPAKNCRCGSESPAPDHGRESEKYH